MVFVPWLTFQGVEGNTFSPMAITVMLALAGAFFLSLTFVPAMLAVLIRGRVAEKEVKIIVWAKERYARGLPKAMARPWATLGIGVGAFALSAVAFQFIGSEFISRPDERNLALSALRLPTTSIEKSMERKG